MVTFYRRSRKADTLALTAVFACLYLVLACNSAENSSGGSPTASGNLNFHLDYHRVASRLQPQAAVLDCSGEGIASVSARVYGPNDTFLQNGGPWDCAAGQGTIRSVPAGSGRRIVILGMDADGKTVLRGEKTGIQVDANTENDAGTIDCYAFVPILQAPADGATVAEDTVKLEWQDVAGANSYRIVVSLNGNLADPVIEETTTSSFHSCSGLSDTTTYYWQVFSIDAHDTMGKGSAIWEFTIDASKPHGITILDSAGDVGMYSTIAAEAGKIFIGYYDETNRKLKVSRSLNDGSDWSRSTVVSDDEMGKGSSIALDEDNVFIATTITINNRERIGISISDDNGENWNTSTILPENSRTSNGYYDEYATSIDVDGENIYITFLTSDVLMMQLLTAPYSADSWTIETIEASDEDFESGYYSSINAHNGSLYISHSGYSEADVYLTQISSLLPNPLTVLVDQIGVQGDKGYTTSVVRQVGSNTHVYIAYYDQSEGNLDLKFAKSQNNGDTFFLSTIDSTSEGVGKYPSMAIHDDSIYICYYDETNGNLKLARSSDSGGNWDIKTVDNSTDDVGQFASLAVDGQNVYISYYDATNKDLKFAKSIDGGDTW
jgi:hypothetical protein